MSLSRFAFALLAVVLTATACEKSDADANKRVLTQREKDSILGASRIPGARAVQKTLNTADSAAARQARLDSAEREP